ncbi:hypothetical protein [Aliarcobacter cryaerophilus]|uniref:hypothetical protein n=1 Tax=Aliarcobacter cryaerophilus TaxID=28198 RepID=UPI0021B2338A|nr:hypothetical protein [Aliarcobacter cryaerophilus]MCT7526745.1 hypothetical protein [Aliarcobacter cryaerophilus]MCT7541443.1 hypothetical protein [Aliarcobacter cryaerophilus]
MKKMLSSFVVTGILTVGNISAIASEYISNTVDIITQIDSKEKIKKNSSQIVEYLQLLNQSDQEFKNNVITFMFDNYKKLESFDLGNKLASIALAIEGKEKRYDVMMKVFKKDRQLISYNKQLIELKDNNSKIKKQIQELIDLVFLHIEAKNYFKYAEDILKNKNLENIALKDYWYIKELEDEDKTLFISIEQNNNIDLESIYLFEDEMNEHIKEASQLKIDIYKKLKIGNQPQIGGYNFSAMNKVFFKRVSIV